MLQNPAASIPAPRQEKPASSEPCRIDLTGSSSEEAPLKKGIQ